MPRKKVLKSLFLMSFMVASVVPLALVAERVRGKYSLSRYKKFLARIGEKMGLAQLASASYSLVDNGAPPLKAAMTGFSKSTLSERLPPRMTLTSSGSAIVGSRSTEWKVGETTLNWSSVEEEMRGYQSSLAAVRSALAKPMFDNQLDYAAGPKMTVTHLAPINNLVHFFGANAMLALNANDLATAVEELEMQMQLLRAIASDRLLVSEWLRIAVAAIARTYIWEALQWDGWTDELLGRLQRAWQESSFLDSMIRSLEGERVLAAINFERMRQSNDETLSILFWLEDHGLDLFTSEDPSSIDMSPKDDFFRNQVYCRTWRFSWLDQNELLFQQNVQDLLQACRSARIHKSFAKVRPLVEKVADRAKPANPYDRLRIRNEISTSTFDPYIPKVMRAETERSLVLAAIALKRYFQRHNHFPESLAALVPEFLDSVPIDFMVGEPLKYAPRVNRGFLLYSVGENLTDDDGNAEMAPGKYGRRNPWSRKDFVWPSAASPQEAAATQPEA